MYHAGKYDPKRDVGETDHTPDPLAELSPDLRALVALMVDNAKIKARQEEIVAMQETQAESIKRLEAKQSPFEERSIGTKP